MENPQNMPTTADYAMHSAYSAEQKIQRLQGRVDELEQQVAAQKRLIDRLTETVQQLHERNGE